MNRKPLIISAAMIAASAIVFAAAQHIALRLGKQKDGAFIVSTLQRVDPGAIAFHGRPTDIAMHPSGQFFAVLDQKSVFLASRDGVIADSSAPLKAGAGFHGLVWSPDGTRLYASVSDGYVESFDLADRALKPHGRIDLRPDDDQANPRPGGMAITRDGGRLFVAAMDRDAVVEVDLANEKRMREYAVEKLRFDVIPALGWLFKRLVHNNHREELLVFLTPKVVSSGTASLPPAKAGCEPQATCANVL